MRGLAYLEWRHASHQIAAILRSPLRLALWLPYALTFGYLLYARSFSPGRGVGRAGIAAGHAETVAGLYAAALGLTIALGAGGRIYAFRNGAEAILFSTAGIRPLEIAVWLQLRKLGASGARWLAGIAYFFLIFAPRNAGALADARIVGIAFLAVALQMSIDLPAFLIARGPLRAPILVFGWALVAGGGGFGALALFAPEYVPAIVAFLHFDPGAALAGLIGGNAWAILAIVAVLAALVGVVAFAGDDALPEIYAASRHLLAPGTPSSDRNFTRNERSSPAGRIPSGALALVWKDWATFRRGRMGPRIWLAGCVFSAACGAAGAIASSAWHDPSLFLSLGATAGIALVVLAPSGASVGLASDLAKPLFWFSRASLRARIAAWTFARTWRNALAIGLAPSCAGLVSGNVTLAIVALPLAVAAYWSLQSLGVGLFALFPNPLDSRGPMLLVRLIATACYAVPPLVVAIAVSALHGTPFFASLASASVLALEGWGVIELAVLRFAANGASLAASARTG